MNNKNIIDKPIYIPENGFIIELIALYLNEAENNQYQLTYDYNIVQSIGKEAVLPENVSEIVKNSVEKLLSDWWS